MAYSDFSHFERQTRISPSSPGTMPEVPKLKILNLSVLNLRISDCSIKSMPQSRLDDRLPGLSEHSPLRVRHPSIFGLQFLEHQV